MKDYVHCFIVRVSISDGVTSWVMQQFRAGVNPRHLLETVLLPGASLVCTYMVAILIYTGRELFLYTLDFR